MRGTCPFCGTEVAFDFCLKCLRARVTVEEVSPAVLEKIIRFVHMEKFIANRKK
jgi:hypothetical protein